MPNNLNCAVTPDHVVDGACVVYISRSPMVSATAIGPVWTAYNHLTVGILDSRLC